MGKGKCYCVIKVGELKNQNAPTLARRSSLCNVGGAIRSTCVFFACMSGSVFRNPLPTGRQAYSGTGRSLLLLPKGFLRKLRDQR